MNLKKLFIFMFGLFIVYPIMNVHAISNELYVNQNNVQMTEEQINNLRNLGFSEIEIIMMNQEEFDNNKNLIGTVEAIDTKYVKTTYVYSGTSVSTSITSTNILVPLRQYSIETLKTLIASEDAAPIRIINEEVTEEEFNSVGENESNIYVTNDVNPDIIETTYKKLTTTISYISSSNQYRLNNDLVWKQMPSNRSYDIFGIGINFANVEPVSGSQLARTTYTTKETCHNTSSTTSVTHSNINNWKREPQGYGVSFQLPSNTTGTVFWGMNQDYPCDLPAGSQLQPAYKQYVDYNINVTALSSTMYYNVTKSNSTALTLSAYGSYQHSVKSISLSTSLGFSITVGGGSLGGVFSIDTSINSASNFDGMAGTHAQLLSPVW